METQEALNKIEEINALMQSGSEAFLSPKYLYRFGGIMAALPFLIWITSSFFGSSDASGKAAALIGVALGLLSFKFVPRTPLEQGNSVHPTIKKAFSIKNPLRVAFIGAGFILVATHRGPFLYPLFLMYFGVLFSVYGMFTSRIVSLFAWSYIACGLAYLYCMQFDFSLLPIFPGAFAVYLGLSLMFMGYLLAKEKLHGTR